MCRREGNCRPLTGIQKIPAWIILDDGIDRTNRKPRWRPVNPGPDNLGSGLNAEFLPHLRRDNYVSEQLAKNFCRADPNQVIERAGVRDNQHYELASLRWVSRSRSRSFHS